jgi:hypothetical protein
MLTLTIVLAGIAILISAATIAICVKTEIEGRKLDRAIAAMRATIAEAERMEAELALLSAIRRA